MQEDKVTQGVTIQRCDNCRIIIVQGGIRWSCDDWHHEVLAWLQFQGRAILPGDKEDSDEQPHQRRTQ